MKKFQMYNAALGLFFEKANTWDHRILELKHSSLLPPKSCSFSLYRGGDRGTENSASFKSPNSFMAHLGPENWVPVMITVPTPLLPGNAQVNVVTV